ncbi:MAG: hypothetical protein ISS45_01240 [Candidatus Omnitrophica bacterium]|nr:hypothetical protein [Candidatus Omnitrophota bacterium]
MNKKHICPVCGFDGLKESPYNKKNEPSYEICPCCGFEFGFDSKNPIKGVHKTYREKWIQNGAEWFLPQSKPKAWELNKQLENIKNI